MKSAGQGAVPVIGLPPAQFEVAFPFHLAVNRNLVLVQAGKTLRRVCPDVMPGTPLDGLFRVVRPEGKLSYGWLVENQRELFLLAHMASGLQLRGEFMLLPCEQTLLFLGSPWFTDSAEIPQHGLGFEDFAIHDPVVDLLQVFQAQKIAMADAKKLLSKLTAQRAELRATNARLHQQEAETRKLALIASRTDNAVVLTDAQGFTEWVNEGFTRLTGYSAEEVIGKKPGDVLQGPGTDPETVRRISEQLRMGEGFLEEILNYTKDGRIYWVSVEVQPIRDEQGRITNFMAIESDVTTRRMAQKRLAIGYEVSRALVEATDVDAAFTQVLEAIGENLGWNVGQLWRLDGERLRLIEAWHPPGAQVSEFLQTSRTMQFAKGIGLPGRIWAKEQPVWVSDVTIDTNFPRGPVARREGLRGAFGFPVFAHGAFWGVMEFFSGKIEEPDEMLLKTFTAVGNQIGQFIVRKEVEEALRVSKEAADAANQAKTEFLATVSHELRTPLTSIRGFMQTVLSDPEMPASARQEFLSVGYDQSVRLSRLVDDLLNLTSLESGRTQFRDEPLDLRQIAETALEEIQPLTTQKNLHLEAALAPSVPVFIGDAVRLQSVFTNLLANAVKFTPAGGTVRLALEASGAEIRISVQDTGPGIPADQQKKIFEKFQRVHQPGASVAGTGLGLPIVKTIVEHYHGRIELESEEGSGSCFRVLLPCET